MKNMKNILSIVIITAVIIMIAAIPQDESEITLTYMILKTTFLIVGIVACYRLNFKQQ